MLDFIAGSTLLKKSDWLTDWLLKLIHQKILRWVRGYKNPIKIKSRESFLEVFERVNEVYESNEHTLFVTHQDTIRSFMYYKLGSQDFNVNKPGHCDLQYIVNDQLKIHINSD